MSDPDDIPDPPVAEWLREIGLRTDHLRLNLLALRVQMWALQVYAPKVAEAIGEAYEAAKARLDVLCVKEAGE